MNNRGNKIKKEKRNFPKAELDPGSLYCKSPSGVSLLNDKSHAQTHPAWSNQNYEETKISFKDSRDKQRKPMYK